MSIGQRIKKCREERKITQREIARSLGVKPGTISKYESGTIELNIEAVKRLAEIFNVSTDKLIKGDEKFDIFQIDICEALKEQKSMDLKDNLYHNTQISFAYNTNHMDGSKLTEAQTKNIYELNTIFLEHDTITNVDDIIETVNHFKLFDYMIDIAKEELTEDMIKDFHKILKGGTLNINRGCSYVGEYRKLPREAGSMQTSSPNNIQSDMQKLMEWYESQKKITIKEIVEFHIRFEKIHPFQNGNGRVGRIIMFKECLKNGIIPFVIQDKDKLFYYRGFEANKSEKKCLTKTCFNAQSQYEAMVKEYLA